MIIAITKFQVVFLNILLSVEDLSKCFLITWKEFLSMFMNCFSMQCQRSCRYCYMDAQHER